MTANGGPNEEERVLQEKPEEDFRRGIGPPFGSILRGTERQRFCLGDVRFTHGSLTADLEELMA